MSQINNINLDECWLYAGITDNKDYGSVPFWDGKAKKQWNLRAHRLTYEKFVGTIPAGLVIDHLCRVTRCVNPDHLEAVTNKENIRRGVFTRAQATHCIRGHLFDEINTRYRIRRVDRPTRVCRTCHKLASRKSRRKPSLVV